MLSRVGGHVEFLANIALSIEFPVRARTNRWISPSAAITIEVRPGMLLASSASFGEVSDIAAMLEQWELANFKPEHQCVVLNTPWGRGIP